MKKNNTITFRTNEQETKRIENIKKILKNYLSIPEEVLTNSYIIHYALYILEKHLKETKGE